MKRKYIAIALVITLVFSLAGVGTMAWFTSQATSTGNSFVAGTLKLGGVGTNGDTVKTFASLNVDNMKPGEPRHVGSTVLKNVGTLPFKLYRITASKYVGLDFEDIQGRSFDDLLDLVITIGEEEVFRGKFSELVKENGGYFDPVLDVVPQAIKELNFSVLLDSSAGNDFQGKSFTCDLTVFATQNEVPENGEPQGTHVNLGTSNVETIHIPVIGNVNSSFTVDAYNDGTYANFDWDWHPDDILFERYYIDIKHEQGQPNNTVDAQRIRVFRTTRVLDVEGTGLLTESDIVVDWDNDIVRINKSKMINAGWDGFEVRLSGSRTDGAPLQQITVGVDSSEEYQYWSLQAGTN